MLAARWVCIGVMFVCWLCIVHTAIAMRRDRLRRDYWKTVLDSDALTLERLSKK